MFPGRSFILMINTRIQKERIVIQKASMRCSELATLPVLNCDQKEYLSRDILKESYKQKNGSFK